MKSFVISLFCLLEISCFAQNDSAKCSLSTNIASGIFFQEAGLYYNLQLSHKSLLEISYGHRFRHITIIENGGKGSEYKFWKQTGDVLRIGYKVYHSPRNKYSSYSPYYYYRISYWNLHTPKYTTRNGSNGLSSTIREVVSADKNLVNLAIGIGKSEQYDNHFFTDFFFIMGLSIGSRRTHQYSYGYSGTEFSYPVDAFKNTSVICPTVEIGVNVGYFW